MVDVGEEDVVACRVTYISVLYAASPRLCANLRVDETRSTRESERKRADRSSPY